MSSIQILSQNPDLGKIFKKRHRNQYKIFCSRSLNYILKNIKEQKIDLTFIDLTEKKLREDFYEFTKKNSSNSNNPLYHTCLLFLSPIELSSDPTYLSLIHRYPYHDQFWWSHHAGERKTFLESLDFFLRKNVQFLRIKRKNLLLSIEKDSLLSLKKNLEMPNKSIVKGSLSKLPVSFLVGESKLIQECHSSIYASCSKHSTTLLVGDVGLEQKEIGYYIHTQSSRHECVFSHINLHQIPTRMHYQRLFGHIQDNQINSDSLITITDQVSGTLLIEGIESLSWNIQSHLLKAIHDRTVLNKKKEKLKLILSMNKDINFLLDSGLFRQDLVSKIKINLIRIPNLKQRKSDMVYIIDQYLNWYQEKYQKKIKITAEIKLLLADYHWPENIDSLYDFLGKLFTLSENGQCELKTLTLLRQKAFPMSFFREGGSTSNLTPSLFSESTLQGIFQPELVNVERLYIEQVIRLENNNVTRAARILGISRKTLYSKLKAYQLKVG